MGREINIRGQGRNQGNYGNNAQNDFDLEKDNVVKWVRNGIDDGSVKYADALGKEIANRRLTTSQIRNIFGEMRRIQMNTYKKEKDAFLLLKPKLAYAVKRHENKGLDLFYKFFCFGYDALDKNNESLGEKHFDNLMHLMEAVLAYHKFHGGKE